MTLYRPSLRLQSKRDTITASNILNALEGLTVDYLFTGERIGKEVIELKVLSQIKDSSGNSF